jgi:thiamine-phosphate pyrophosphorylase
MKINFSKFKLYPIIDYGLLKDRIYDVTEQLISYGVGIIQFRAKNLTDKEFVNYALKLRQLTQNITFIINDRIDIALIVEADGVHLGQDDIPIPLARKLLKDKIIGLSTHNLAQAIQAGKEEIDYLAIGPIYQTTTKKKATTPIGVEIIQKIKEKVSIPVIAIGGINEDNIEEVIKAGTDAVAIASGLFKGKNLTLNMQIFMKLNMRGIK